MAKLISEIPLIHYLRILYKSKLIIIALTIIVGASAAVYSLFMPLSYSSNSKIMLSEKGGGGARLSGLGALAANLGFAQMSSDGPEISAGDVLDSRSFLNRLRDKKFKTEKFNGELKRLIEIIGFEDYSEAEKNFYFILSLANSIEMSTTKGSRLIKLKVSGPEPPFCKDLADTIINELNLYYGELQISKRKAVRMFIENRLNEISEELKYEENVLKNFQEKNREIHNSPELSLRQARLMRKVRIKEEMFITVTKEFEIAKIEEIKDTPTIKVVDPPEIPLYRSSPQRKKIVLAFAFLGFLIGCVLAIGLEYRRSIFEYVRSVTH
ncbi:Wzz/FepE/Etk N-terminal domain-containing protein [Fibrobacterota bacterium]